MRILCHSPASATPAWTLRVGQFIGPLAARGIQVRTADEFPSEAAGLAWCDAVLLRRWISTSPAAPFPVDAGIEALLERSNRPRILYDTDDDVTGGRPIALDAFMRAARPLTLRMIAVADVVTCSTPLLAERLAPFCRAGASPVVVRNAIDVANYRPTYPPGPGPVRVGHYGSSSRIRDYNTVRGLVDAIPGIWTVWLGCGSLTITDETWPAVPLTDWPATLAAARLDIGLAPSVDEPFSRARSELHWLEYSACHVPTIAADLEPYRVIRHGIDGLLAQTSDDWRRHLTRLASSANLRAEIAGRAYERVAAEYSLERRVSEWEAAWRG